MLFRDILRFTALHTIICMQNNHHILTNMEGVSTMSEDERLSEIHRKILEHAIRDYEERIMMLRQQINGSTEFRSIS